MKVGLNAKFLPSKSRAILFVFIFAAQKGRTCIVEWGCVRGKEGIRSGVGLAICICGRVVASELVQAAPMWPSRCQDPTAGWCTSGNVASCLIAKWLIGAHSLSRLLCERLHCPSEIMSPVNSLFLSDLTIF
jgi:hypothetical protein